MRDESEFDTSDDEVCVEVRDMIEILALRARIPRARTPRTSFRFDVILVALSNSSIEYFSK